MALLTPHDIEEAMVELGIEITRVSDDEITGRCPAHAERTGAADRNPSWSVNRDTGMFNCFSCGFSGDFKSLVMCVLFPHDAFRAARWIRNRGLSQEHLTVEHDEDRRVRQIEETYGLVNVTEVPEIRLAMFDDVPDWALDKRRIDRESCDLYGLRWDSEDDAWIIPVRRSDSELMGWQRKWEGKRRFKNEPRDMKKSLCLFGMDVFPSDSVDIEDYIPAVLLESPLDVCRLHSAGFYGGLSSFGASVSEAQMRMIQAATMELVLALDNDHDGQLHTRDIVRGKVERGKTVSKAWVLDTGLQIRCFSYRGTDSKDIGDMEDSEIRRGLYDALPAMIAVPARRKPRELRRSPTPVPGRRPRQDDRPRPRTSHL